MPKSLRTLITGLVVSLFSMAAAAQSSPAREQLEQFSSDLETLQASFVQTVIGPDGRMEDEVSGQVWLRRPSQFRWAYEGDFPEIVIADGTTVWLYDEALEQVTIRDQSAMSTDTPLTLLTDISGLDDQFDVRDLSGDTGYRILELQSRQAEAEFERVLLGFENDSLQLMAMEDAFGLRTEIRFSDIQRNPELDADLFSFDIPPGTDVIGDPLSEFTVQ